MTAITPEQTALDTAALSADIAAVLTAHGITGADVSVRPIEQGGMPAGVTISATAYERPAGLPDPTGRDNDNDADLDALFQGITAHLAPAAPNLTVVK